MTAGLISPPIFKHEESAPEVPTLALLNTVGQSTVTSRGNTNRNNFHLVKKFDTMSTDASKERMQRHENVGQDNDYEIAAQYNGMG